MGFKDFLRNTMMRMDLLSASPNLRVRQQPQYQTVLGGFISFSIMCIFGYILYAQFVTMFSKLDISYSQGLQDDLQSDTTISDVQFAVAIDGVDLSVTPRKFQFLLSQTSIAPVNGTPTLVKTPITLSPCQKSDWSSLGDNFQSQFTAFGFDKMLCISSGQSYEIAGYIGSPTYKYLTFDIIQCDPMRDPNCDTTANSNAYMTNFLTTSDYFKVRFFLVDTIITPDSNDAITKILEKNIFLAFTKTVGTVGYINMAEYTLKTDTSYLPNEDYYEESGSFIEGFQTNSVSISSTKYVSLDLFKSTKSLTITRTIGKIDVVLSYVGGLFGLLFTGVAFFIGSYSEMKYEIYVAESMLSLDEKGRKIKEEDFGFFTYLGYACYDWLDTFNIAPKCLKRMSQIHDVREQACNQMDPLIILKRIKYLEDVSKILMSQHREMCCHLTGPVTLQQARRMRNTLMFYDKVIGQLEDKKDKDEEEKQVSDDKFMLIHNGNAIQNVNQSDLIRDEEVREPQKELSEQEEEELLVVLMAEAVDKLEKDNSEVAQRIRQRIPVKAREIVKDTRKEKLACSLSSPNDLVSPVSPLHKNQSDIHLQDNKKQIKINIKRVKS